MARGRRQGRGGGRGRQRQRQRQRQGALRPRSSGENEGQGKGRWPVEDPGVSPEAPAAAPEPDRVDICSEESFPASDPPGW